MPPELVSYPDDIIEYTVETAKEVKKMNVKPGYLERHIYSETCKKFPGSRGSPLVVIPLYISFISTDLKLKRMDA